MRPAMPRTVGGSTVGPCVPTWRARARPRPGRDPGPSATVPMGGGRGSAAAPGAFRGYHRTMTDIASGPPVTGVAAPGSVDGLGLQLERYRVELTAYCYRMLGSAFEAEDAVQDTMVR